MIIFSVQVYAMEIGKELGVGEIEMALRAASLCTTSVRSPSRNTSSTNLESLLAKSFRR